MVELAMLADLQGTVYPKCHPSTARHGAGQGKHYRPLAGTYWAYPRSDGQAELTWMVG